MRRAADLLFAPGRPIGNIAKMQFPGLIRTGSPPQPMSNTRGMGFDPLDDQGVTKRQAIANLKSLPRYRFRVPGLLKNK